LAKRVCVLLLGILCGTCAQARQEQAVGETQQSTSSASAVDPKTHDAAVKLVDAIGMRQRMKDSLDKVLADGVERMKKQPPQLNPAFYEEWTRRMKARVNFDDYVATAVHAYEKYFTAAELDEMTQAQLAANESKTPTYSAPLREKLQRVSSSVMSEIIGGCTQLGAKLGADIGTEIGKEHPEWATTAGAKDAPAQK
jgi:hypothetical protein